MTRAILVVLLLLISSPGSAEAPLLAWPAHRPIADWISTGLAVGQIGAEVIENWRAPHRGRAFLNQGCRVLFVLGTSRIVKSTLPRTRPDGSNRHSFWSEHTAHAVANAGWRFEVGIPVAAAVGLLRGGAAKHYLSDVGVGALDGALAYVACRWIEVDP